MSPRSIGQRTGSLRVPSARWTMVTRLPRLTCQPAGHANRKHPGGWGLSSPPNTSAAKVMSAGGEVAVSVRGTHDRYLLGRYHDARGGGPSVLSEGE